MACKGNNPVASSPNPTRTGRGCAAAPKALERHHGVVSRSIYIVVYERTSLDGDAGHERGETSWIELIKIQRKRAIYVPGAPQPAPPRASIGALPGLVPVVPWEHYDRPANGRAMAFNCDSSSCMKTVGWAKTLFLTSSTSLSYIISLCGHSLASKTASRRRFQAFCLSTRPGGGQLRPSSRHWCHGAALRPRQPPWSPRHDTIGLQTPARAQRLAILKAPRYQAALSLLVGRKRSAC